MLGKRKCYARGQSTGKDKNNPNIYIISLSLNVGYLNTFYTSTAEVCFVRATPRRQDWLAGIHAPMHRLLGLFTARDRLYCQCYMQVFLTQV